MAKQAYVYSGTDWVPLASEVTNLSGYQTKALNQFANRNLVINGDMQIAQRGTSVASITTADYRTADRWKFSPSSMGTWTMSQEADAPTGSGFRTSAKLLCTTADASPAAGDALQFDQRIEGQNLQQVKKGTAAAEQLTISFWVKANVTGTYIVDFYDNDNARSVSKSYTINASGTWEYKTITFPADTTGAFDNDNALSLYVTWWLGAGSNFTSGTLGTTWASSTAANRAVGQVNLASAINNYWQVTGVQLEVGDTATPFEFKSFGQELNECERYYQKSYPYAIVPGTGTNYVGSVSGIARDSAAIVAHAGRFVQTMRAFPTVTIYHQDGTVNAVYEINTGTKKTGASANHIGDKGYWEVSASALTSGQNYYWHHTASAEL
jgi:hypothetical protein